jgi:hypothetical protein
MAAVAKVRPLPRYCYCSKLRFANTIEEHSSGEPVSPLR